MTAIKTSIHVLAWVIIVVLGAAIIWTVLAPWAPARPAEQALVGQWTARPIPGREINVVLSGDHMFSSADWPSEVGCDGPLMLRSRTPETVRWVKVEKVIAEWYQDDYFRGIKLEPQITATGECSPALTFYAERNMLTGQYRLSVFYAALDEDYYNYKMIFHRS